jgi:hypothetical protein
MAGDAADMLGRLLSLLPPRWFPDTAPLLAALGAGLAEGWAWIYELLDQVRRQTRLATVTDSLLDLAAQDFFAGELPRRFGEADDAFRARVRRELLRDRATRVALVGVLTDLTGRTPIVFEPTRPLDTGAWHIAGGYGVAGGWGSMRLPYQVFVTAFRAQGSGVPLIGGWTTGAGGWGQGALRYVSAQMVESQVTDADINAAIARTLPVATTAWTRISN